MFAVTVMVTRTVREFCVDRRSSASVRGGDREKSRVSRRVLMFCHGHAVDCGRYRISFDKPMLRSKIWAHRKKRYSEYVAIRGNFSR
jgi:hypothetical protein